MIKAINNLLLLLTVCVILVSTTTHAASYPEKFRDEYADTLPRDIKECQPLLKVGREVSSYFLGRNKGNIYGEKALVAQQESCVSAMNKQALIEDKRNEGKRQYIGDRKKNIGMFGIDIGQPYPFHKTEFSKLIHRAKGYPDDRFNTRMKVMLNVSSKDKIYVNISNGYIKSVKYVTDISVGVEQSVQITNDLFAMFKTTYPNDITGIKNCPAKRSYALCSFQVKNTRVLINHDINAGFYMILEDAKPAYTTKKVKVSNSVFN